MKKNISKHLLALVTFVVSLLTVFIVSFSVSAADYTSGDWTYSVSNNVATVKGYTGSATSIILPTTLGGYKVAAVGERVFENNTAITSVTIPEGYTVIGRSAFQGCTYLKTVSIPKTIEYIGDSRYRDWGSTFQNCIRLETVTFAEGGKKEAVINEKSFSGCTALKGVTIPANYKTICADAFNGCTSLENLTIKENEDEAISRIIDEYAFYNCTSLKSVNIPEGYTMIGRYAFQGCTYLKTVSIPKTMEYIGDSRYRDWGSTFQNCIRLETVTFVEGGKKDAYINENSFSGCTALKSITIPANYKAIYSDAFNGCTSLNSVYIKDNADEYFERSLVQNAFNGCTNLAQIHIPEGFTSIGKDCFKNCSSNLVICSTSSDCAAKTYADANGIKFKVCNGNHGSVPETVYTVTYNANGGSVSPSSANVTSGNSTTLPTPTKSYKITYNANGGSNAPSAQSVSITCKGWSTSSSATSASYSCGSSYKPSKNITLYAVWNSTASTSIKSGTPTKSGYTFLGWSKSSNPTSAAYVSGDSITVNSDITLYAVWQKIPTVEYYTVNYYANGGSVSPTSIDVEKGKSTTLPTPTKKVNITYNANGGSNAPSVQNCSLNCSGWATNSSATTGAYSCGASYTPTKDITLYAVWQKTTVTLTSSAPTRSGYKFLGWSRESTATTASYTAGGKMNVAGNVTLYAVWEENPVAVSYTLKYNANGGMGSPANQTGSTVYVISSEIPVKEGYTFLGWSINPAGDYANFVPGDEVTLTQNVTLYAVWEKITETTYSITYNANGGSGAPSVQTGSKGYTISSKIPTREGYNFLGWSMNKNATTGIYMPGNYITLTGNITLYAIWEREVGVVNDVRVDDLQLDYKASETIYVKVNGTDDYDIKFNTSNASVATVDENGIVTATGTGEAEITVTVTDEYGNVIEDTCKVTVSYAWWQWLIIIFLFGWIWY